MSFKAINTREIGPFFVYPWCPIIHLGVIKTKSYIPHVGDFLTYLQSANIQNSHFYIKAALFLLCLQQKGFRGNILTSARLIIREYALYRDFPNLTNAAPVLYIHGLYVIS